MATATAPDPIGNTVSVCELTVAILESELGPVAAKWETLGRKLGIQEWRLEIIAADHPAGAGASMRRLSAVLQEWRKNVTDGSWSNIICALREMQEKVLAREIEDKYCNIAQGLSQAQSCEAQQEKSEEAVALIDTNKEMMKDRFAQLLTVIYQKIQERLNAKEIKIRDFRVYMTTLFPPGKCIPETSEVSEIFTAITHNRLWDYLNYEPLIRVAKMYGGKEPDLEAKLKAYKQDLVGYKVVTKMVDYISTVTVASSSDLEDEDESSPPLARKDRLFRKELTVKLKIPISAQSLSYVDEVWASLAEIFLLPPSSAILDRIIEGSLYITWLIPAFFVVQMMEIAEQPEVAQFFREMKAETVTVDGVCLYEEHEKQKTCDSSLDENQEPPPKPEVLAMASEEEIETDQCHDTWSSSTHEEEGNQFDEKKLSFIQVEAIGTTINRKQQETSLPLDDSSNGLFDESQESIPKSDELTTAADSFQEEIVADHNTECNAQEVGDSSDRLFDASIPKPDEITANSFQEIVADHNIEHNTQCSSICEDGENQSGEKKSSSKLATTTTSSQAEEEVDTTRNSCRELQEISLEESSFAEAVAVKSADDKPSQHPHSHPEPHPHPHKPRITGYDVELVKESHDFQCPICLLVLRNPMQANCCGKRFCQSCIEPLIAKAEPCPFCKHKHIEIFEDKAQKQAVMGVRVHCTNSHLECYWRGELCQLDNHLNLAPQKERLLDGCEYAKIKCLHCSKDYQRFYLSCHMRNCPQQPYTCPYCKHYESTYEDVTRHHFPLCEEFHQSTILPLEPHSVEPPSVFVPPPSFFMTNFTGHQRDKKEWFSPPFHSHIGGYKMCLSVNVSGSRFNYPHISIYAYIMRGEFDENLSWPFRGDITVHLLNQKRDEGHIELTISFDDDTPGECADQVINGERALRGWGRANFIPHSALHYNKIWNTDISRVTICSFK